MIYHRAPDDFRPKFEIVSCFVEVMGEILLLLRNDNKPQPNTWGVPAGKRGSTEERLQAIIREIFEETGLQLLMAWSAFQCSVYVRYPEYDFVYHIFHLELPEKFKVVINPKEHKGYVWATPRHALTMPLIGDLDECIKFFYSI